MRRPDEAATSAPRAALDRVLTALDCDATYHSALIHPANLIELLVERAGVRSGGVQAAISSDRDT